MPFIVVPFILDADTLADEALDRLADSWEGWEGQDGDLEVIQIESLAPMAADVAEAAATVPDAIFRNYGMSLLGVTYKTGQSAVASARFTAIDSTGYTTSVPVEFDLDGMAFTTDVAVVIAAGATTVDVTCTANEIGTGGNGKWGFADPMSPLPWMLSIEVVSPSIGGTEEETDAEYQDRLSDRLLLQTTTLVTGRDFELMALQVDGVGRAMALPNQARQVTVALADDNGAIIPGGTGAGTIKGTVLDLFDDYRQVNTQYSVIDATYTTINVAATVVVLPDYEPAVVKSACETAVAEWLSPANWGRPRTSEGPSDNWLNETVVRWSELLRVLSVSGVRYVQAATLNGGTADLNLSGTAPLTLVGSNVVTAT